MKQSITHPSGAPPCAEETNNKRTRANTGVTQDEHARTLDARCANTGVTQDEHARTLDARCANTGVTHANRVREIERAVARIGMWMRIFESALQNGGETELASAARIVGEDCCELQAGMWRASR